MKKQLILAILLSAPAISTADLGILTDPSEILAKTGAAGLGITQVYDHPNQVVNGQFYVPVTYNGNNGVESDPTLPNSSDIDYIPLSQMKGLNGTPGAVGATGASGTQGVAGSPGVQGIKGDKGDPGTNADTSSQMEVEGVLRLYDGKRFVVEAFDNYSLRDAHNNAFGGRITFKIGHSYVEDQIDALNRKLEANLNVLQVIE